MKERTGLTRALGRHYNLHQQPFYVYLSAAAFITYCSQLSTTFLVGGPSSPCLPPVVGVLLQTFTAKVHTLSGNCADIPPLNLKTPEISMSGFAAVTAIAPGSHRLHHHKDKRKVQLAPSTCTSLEKLSWKKFTPSFPTSSPCKTFHNSFRTRSRR